MTTSQLAERFGEYGGMYAPESLVGVLKEVADGFAACVQDSSFNHELDDLLANYAGRPTPITYAKRLSKQLGANIYLKREDLIHGGAHKTNNCLGQVLLAKHLGKTRIIAETGAGQHGVATAMVAALLGLPATIYMGAADIKRQKPNVDRMKLFGAKVVAVTSGNATLKDAINEAMRDWITYADQTYYCFGTVAGPHPFPQMVRHFQSVIGIEAREQMLTMTGRLPDSVIACVGGGSNAIGIFSAFLDDEQVAIFGAEPAGLGLDTGKHAATLQRGSSAVFHGMHSLFLQDSYGQITEPHSVSAGLDYPGVGPEHAHLHQTGRVKYLGVTDEQALDAFALLSRKEGIIPALESAHALALAGVLASGEQAGTNILVNLSGRGDKDLASFNQARGVEDE